MEPLLPTMEPTPGENKLEPRCGENKHFREHFVPALTLRHEIQKIQQGFIHEASWV